MHKIKSMIVFWPRCVLYFFANVPAVAAKYRAIVFHTVAMNAGLYDDTFC